MITIAVSAYLMKYDDELYRVLQKPLSLFERKSGTKNDKTDTSYKLVLFGYRKGGYEFVEAFRDMRKRYIVVDYNPEVIETLEQQHVHHMYGDATDFELLEEIGVRKSELVVSTLSDYDANLLIAEYILKDNPDTIFVCHAHDLDQAAKLYEVGAAYVTLPHLIGNEHMSAFIRKNGSDREAFEVYRKRHILTLGKVAVD